MSSHTSKAPVGALSILNLLPIHKRSSYISHHYRKERQRKPQRSAGLGEVQSKPRRARSKIVYRRWSRHGTIYAVLVDLICREPVLIGAILTALLVLDELKEEGSTPRRLCCGEYKSFWLTFLSSNFNKWHIQSGLPRYSERAFQLEGAIIIMYSFALYTGIADRRLLQSATVTVDFVHNPRNGDAVPAQC